MAKKSSNHLNERRNKMLSSDYFIQTNQMLAENKRFKELIEFCEYAISSAVWLTPIERQCEALCRWTLAEHYFFNIGDAKKAREGYKSFLKYVDSDISMITEAPTFKEIMEDMYAKSCVGMGQLAISYDEYFTFIKKIETVRPLTKIQKNQMDNIEYNRYHGVSWCDNIVQSAQLEVKSVDSGALDRLPVAVAISSLLLIYPETEPPIDILRTAIDIYSVFVCRFIGASVLHCASKKHPSNPDNYRFILEQAIDLVGEFLEDMEIQDIAKEAREKLVKMKRGNDKSNFYNYGFASIAPPGVTDFIPPLILKEQMKQNLSNPGMPDLPKQGCMTLLAIPIIILCGMISLLTTFF